MPKMQDADNGCRLITHVKDKKRRQRHFPNSAPLVVERKALWHRGQTQRVRKKPLTQADCRVGIILRHEFDDLFEVSDRAVGD